MGKFACHISFRLHVGGFDYQPISSHTVFQQVICPSCVTDVNISNSLFNLSQHIIWRYDPAIIQSHGFAINQVLSLWSQGNTEFLCLFRQEWTSWLFLEKESEAIRTPVINRECIDAEIFRLEEHSRFKLMHMNGHWFPCAPQYNTVDQVMDPFQRPLPCINIQFIDRFPSRKRGKKPAQPKDMIQVSMGDQDVL